MEGIFPTDGLLHQIQCSIWLLSHSRYVLKKVQFTRWIQESRGEYSTMETHSPILWMTHLGREYFRVPEDDKSNIFLLSLLTFKVMVIFCHFSKYLEHKHTGSMEI